MGCSGGLGGCEDGADGIVFRQHDIEAPDEMGLGKAFLCEGSCRQSQFLVLLFFSGLFDLTVSVPTDSVLGKHKFPQNPRAGDEEGAMVRKEDGDGSPVDVELKNANSAITPNRSKLAKSND